MSNSVKPQQKAKKLSSAPLKGKENSTPNSTGYSYPLPCSQLSAEQNRDLVNRLIDALKTL